MVSKTKSKTVIIWQRMGPYHIARLRAASSHLKAAGIEIIGIEIARTDAIYQWDVFNDRDGTMTETLFPDATLENLSSVAIWKALYARLRHHQPDVVAICGWSTPDALCALHWCMNNGARAILMSESKEDDRPRNIIIETIKSAIVRHYDAAVVGGSPHKDYILRLGIPESKIFVGYDVVDNDFFFEKSLNARMNSEEIRTKLILPDKYLLSVSRFVEEKNLFRLVEAYKRYSSSIPTDKRLPLVICGSGILENRLRSVASGINSIIWSGFRQISELPAIYALASAFIIPSTVEPWGLVVNEAMACGLPILSSRTAGSRYDLVMDGKNGFLFDPFNISDIANCMTKFTMLDDFERERMSKNSLAVISDWSPNRFADALLKAIKTSDE